MLARLSSASLRGLDAEAVDVEVDLSRGLPVWTLVYHIKPAADSHLFLQLGCCSARKIDPPVASSTNDLVGGKNRSDHSGNESKS